MDTVHSLIFVALSIQSVVLVVALVVSLKIAGIVAVVEESNKKIAEIASRNELMTMDILKRVYESVTPTA